jgi:hypothetical protein
MKAIVQEKYGSPVDVLELKDIDKSLGGYYDVLVRVHAASVNPADWHDDRPEMPSGACADRLFTQLPRSGIPRRP